MAQFNSKNKASRVARRWFTDIDINMKNHPTTGDVVLKYDLNAIKSSVRNLVSTNYYERPFKPGVGVNLRGMMFELDNTDILVFEEGIERLINTFEPRVSISNVITSADRHELDVTIHFTVGNSPEPHSLDIILERIR